MSNQKRNKDMSQRIKYSMSISKDHENVYKIKLINSAVRPQQVLFEFNSGKIPSVDKVIEIYQCLNLAKQ